jgi:hypothetical protein
MARVITVCVLAFVTLFLALPAQAADEEAVALFNGKNLTGWTCKPNGWHVDEEGAIAWKKGSGYLWSEKKFQNFILDLDFKVDKGTNSGVFIRTANTRNCVQTGMEVQVLDSFGKKNVGKHDVGAIYDVMAPSKNMAKKAGEWQHMTITAKGTTLQVALNGEQIIDMDLAKWTEPNKNPDGSKNKFKAPYNTMTHAGHIGFQDHGKAVWFKNITIKVLPDSEK